MSVLVTVLARDEQGDESADPRRTLRLTGCARLAAAYRTGEELRPLDLAGLRELLRRNGGTPVYGWEFVDAPDRPWLDRPSLDLALGGPGGHHLTLFQDLQGEADLDVRVWFAELAVLDGDGARLPLDEVIGAGRRWWDAMYAGARSDHAPGIVSLGTPRRRWWSVFRRTAR